MRARHRDVAAFQAGTSKRDPGRPRARNGGVRAHKEPALGLAPLPHLQAVPVAGWGPEEGGNWWPGRSRPCSPVPPDFPTVGF